MKAIASGGVADYLLSDYRDSFRQVMLQGDGWRGFQLFLFDSGERRSVRGVVLSNSCDVDPETHAIFQHASNICTLVKLSAYGRWAVWYEAGQKWEPKIAGNQAQKTTNIFSRLRRAPCGRLWAAARRGTINAGCRAHKSGDRRSCLRLAIRASTCLHSSCPFTSAVAFSRSTHKRADRPSRFSKEEEMPKGTWKHAGGTGSLAANGDTSGTARSSG